jgi:hypothetical protein
MFRRNPGKIACSMAWTMSAVLAAVLLFPPRVLAGTAGVGWNETIAEKSGKQGTVAGLAKLYDSGPCAECHREIYEQWRKSTHSASLFNGGRMTAALRKFIHEGLIRWPSSGVKAPGDVKVKHLMVCAKCHLPQLADATDEVAREIVETIEAWQGAIDGNDPKTRDQAAEKLSSMNIGCLLCHNRNAVIHKLVDGYPAAGAVYGSREGAHPGSFAVLKKGEVLGESIFCGQCHGYGPNFDLENPTQCATAYGSYLFAYVRGGGRETCQDCHMRKSRLGHNIQGASEPVMDNAALDVATDVRGYLWRDVSIYVPRVVVEVSLTNRAGHAIPEGPPSSKRLALEVTATGGDNNAPLFSETRNFRSVYLRFGRGGRVGEGPHEDSGFTGDTSLPPLKTVRERVDFVPKSEDIAGGRVSVRVRIRQLEDGTRDSGARDWYEFRKELKLETTP